MTEEAQKIAIAGACGKRYHKPTKAEIASGSYYQYEPDYLHDLNAMHEAGAGLAAEQQLHFILRLKVVLGLLGQTRHWKHVEFDLAHATAAQRAEAFLRVKGLWVDTPEPVPA